MKLRPYQETAVQAIYNYFECGNAGNPLLILPTGSGKSVVQAAFIRRALTEFPSERIMCLTHVRELIAQNEDKLRMYWPQASIGVYSAGLRRRELGYPITIAGIQSVYRRAKEVGKTSLIIIDECHLVPKKGEGMYRRFLAEMRELNPYLKVIGLTATAYRLGTGHLHEGDGRIFTDVAYQAPIPELIQNGYLCNMVSKVGETEPDLSSVHIRGGEFIAGEAEEAMNQAELVRGAVNEILRLTRDPYGSRRKWLVFCTGVKHAFAVRDELRRQDVSAATVTGETPHAARDRILQDFREGRLQALTNVSCLTTGLDVPDIDLIVGLRPTQSPGLYYQMAGRGLRIHPDKSDTLYLDFAGNLMRHGPLDAIKPSAKAEGNGEAPLKVCKKCRAAVPIAATTCTQCGAAFDVKPQGPKHTTRANFGKILSTESSGLERIQFDVDEVRYSVHKKLGKPPSLKVTYQCGLRFFHEWVCLEHPGYAGDKARSWWRRRTTQRVPRTVLEAVHFAGCVLQEPRQIVVDLSSRFPNIVSCQDFVAPPVEVLEQAQ